MENENLTKLTKGIIQIKSSLPVPVLSHCIYDDRTYIHEYQFKICRYVGSSCRVIGTCYNIDDAHEKLAYWREFYKLDDIFLVQVAVHVYKLSD